MEKPQLKIFPATGSNQVGFVFSEPVLNSGSVDAKISSQVSHDIYELSLLPNLSTVLRNFICRLAGIEHVERIYISRNEILVTIDPLFETGTLHAQAISVLELGFAQEWEEILM